MYWINLKRIIRSGYKNFIRSGFTTIASTLTVTITLMVLTTIILLQATLTTSLNNIKDKVDVTVYFVTGANEKTIFEIRDDLKKIPEVATVEYTSQDDALAIFKDKHADDYLTLQALEELNENPLGASLNIKAKDPSQYESIIKYFDSNTALSKQAEDVIYKKDYHQNKIVIDKLTSIIKGARKLGIVVTSIMIIISLIITLNTIRLIIYMSREEINVMRLVGAENKYIRGPFMVSGILVGCFSALISIVVFWPISYWLGNNMTDFLGVDLYSYFKSNFFQLLVINLFSGVLLGIISSFIAIRRYLKK